MIMICEEEATLEAQTLLLSTSLSLLVYCSINEDDDDSTVRLASMHVITILLC